MYRTVIFKIFTNIYHMIFDLEQLQNYKMYDSLHVGLCINVLQLLNTQKKNSYATSIHYGRMSHMLFGCSIPRKM